MWQDFKLGEIEAVLFAAGEPVSVAQLAEILSLTKPQVWELVTQLGEAYKDEKRGLMLREVGGGFQLCTKEAFDEAVNQLAATKELKLTNAAMETLAIIAFKQPVTRSEMEAIRGVKVDGVVNTLLEYGLIAEAGRKDTVGKPIMYATTAKFLETFGIKSLEDLPRLPDEALGAKPETPEELSLLDFADAEQETETVPAEGNTATVAENTGAVTPAATKQAAASVTTTETAAPAITEAATELTAKEPEHLKA
jgi:segregation and condensation protein B